VVPCALLTVAAIVVLGPPLGRPLGPPRTSPYWEHITGGVTGGVHPEPTEHARYLISLCGPVLLATVVVLGTRRGVSLGAPAIRLLTRAGSLLVLAFAVAMDAYQRALVFGPPRFPSPARHRVYFKPGTLVVAVAVAAALASLPHWPRALERIRSATRETPARRAVGLVVALAAIALWLLTAFNTEGSIGATYQGVWVNFPYWLNEAFAVLQGTPPLVSFHAQYSQLWPYLAAGAMAIGGTSFGVYSLVMVTGTAAGLAAVWALLRRIVGSSLLTLGLFLPFLAHSFFRELGTLHDRYGPAQLYSLFPMRYAGPYVAAWLVARHVDGAWPRRRWLLFAFGGLVLINNVEFGLPAFGATLVAFVCADGELSWRGIGKLLRDAALGALVAAALVALLTLAVAGSLPHFDWMFTFAQLYGRLGFGMGAMPTLGMHLVVYLTFAAAIVVAAVRMAQRAPDRVLTALLAWTGVFGLGAGSYYAGRSHPELLIALFSIWALTLCLLVVVVMRAICARASHRPRAAELAVLVGFGLCVVSLAQTPTPWSQIQRLNEATALPRFRDTPQARFIDRETSPGEVVLILGELGQRIAYDAGIVNVNPFASQDTMPLISQLREAVERLRARDGHKIFFSRPTGSQDELDWLSSIGYATIAAEEPQLWELTDR
jgi:hypothetical protein